MIKLNIYFLLITGLIVIGLMVVFLYLIITEHPSISIYEYISILFGCFLTLGIYINIGKIQHPLKMSPKIFGWIIMFMLIFQCLLIAYFLLRLINTGISTSGMPLFNQISTVILAILSIYLSIRLHVTFVKMSNEII